MIRELCARFRARTIEVAGDESGQALVMLTLMMVLMLGFCGLVIDFGRCYIAYRQLQSSTDAAALAGANQLPNSTAVAMATAYGGGTGENNAYSNLTGVTFSTGYPKVACLTTLTAEGVACASPALGNALLVEQKVTVQLYFGSLFGQSSVTLQAAAAASARGTVLNPYNIAIVLDATDSMVANHDSNCGGVTRFACALSGLKTLMQNMAPCAGTLTTCTITNDVSAQSNDRVAIFSFPERTVGTVNDTYNCSGTAATPVVYDFPSSTGTSYDPSGSTTTSYVSGSTASTYLLTPFWSDYKTANSASTLNTSSPLAKLVGDGCSAMATSGGEGTYYAGVIYAAQGALAAEQAANPGSQNVMIILTDGDASASTTQMKTTATGYSATSGVYPSNAQQCAQAVTAAHYATAQGTRVYAVAYGATTTGCSTDLTTGPYYDNPCNVMKNMASSLQYFYSDYAQSGSGIDASCQSSAQPATSLNQIFLDIASEFTSARLIPISTT